MTYTGFKMEIVVGQEILTVPDHLYTYPQGPRSSQFLVIYVNMSFFLLFLLPNLPYLSTFPFCLALSFLSLPHNNLLMVRKYDITSCKFNLTFLNDFYKNMCHTDVIIVSNNKNRQTTQSFCHMVFACLYLFCLDFSTSLAMFRRLNSYVAVLMLLIRGYILK